MAMTGISGPLNDFGTPLTMIGSTIDTRLDALRKEIKAINAETNPVARFFLKLKYLFKYEEFPPSDTGNINIFDAIPLYNSIYKRIQNAPDNGDGCIKIKDATSAYDLNYIRCTNMWSVTARSILDGQISDNISGQQTIPHQKMLEFVGIQPRDVVSASDYSNMITQSFEKNQKCLQFILATCPDLDPFFDGLRCDVTNYSPINGHKFTVGDVCGSPVAMLLAGYASGTLTAKTDQPLAFMTDVMCRYKKIIEGWQSGNDWRRKNGPEISKLANSLMNNLQPVVARPLASNAHSGLLFLGDNINDRLDSDYGIQARVISLLSSAGAEFLRGNHDSFDFETKFYNSAETEYDKQIVVQLRNFFLPALYVPETDTLYTHNGVKLDTTETKVLYAFPDQDGLLVLNLNNKEPKGKQICDYITKNISSYDDYAKIVDDDSRAAEKTPTKFRPEMTELESCAQRLGIKQVAGHNGYGVQTKGNATRINGVKMIENKEYTVPIAAITGM